SGSALGIACQSAVMRIGDVGSFEDLRAYLSRFTQWEGDWPYDHGGVMVLLAAVLDNLRQNALDEDLCRISPYLDDEQRSFLARLGEYAGQPADDECLCGSTSPEPCWLDAGAKRRTRWCRPHWTPPEAPGVGWVTNALQALSRGERTRVRVSGG